MMSAFDSPAQTVATHFPIAENICTVVSNDWVNSDYKHLILAAPAVALAAKPGQFFHIACPADGENRAFLRRPMSVYRVRAGSGHIEFLYKVTGLGTRGMAGLAPDDDLDVFGPLGLGFTLPIRPEHVLMAARGVGLATLAPLAEAAIAAGSAVTAILSARNPDLLMSQDYLRAVGATVWTVVDTDGSSEIEHVEALIRKAHAAKPFDLLATCGSNRLLMLLQRLGLEFDVKGQVALEQHMGCAIGMCFCCVRSFKTEAGTKYRRVCWEGPVFDLQEAISW